MKKFKKIIFSICFILTFIFSINIKLFAYENGYEIDNNGNIESLNLLNINEMKNWGYNQVNNVETTNNKIRLNYNSSSNDPYAVCYNYITLTSGTYTLSYESTNSEMFVLKDKITDEFIAFIHSNTYTFTIENEILLEIRVDGLGQGETYAEFKNIMLNRGNEQLEYFPYGTYYNSSNTLNNNTYLSPFNIDYVESETFYINGILEQGEEPVGYGGTYLFYDIEHTTAQGNNNWKSIINFNRMLPSMTILYKPSGNNFYHLYVYKNEELLYDRAVRYNENYEESDYYLTIPEFNRIELYCDIENVSAPNQEIVLANTYEQGYTYGYSNGYNQGYAEGESSSYGNGYSTGYQKGIREANQNSLYNMILAIVDTPIHIFKGIFDFNVLGINLTNFVLSLISILIVVWLLKFFL